MTLSSSASHVTAASLTALLDLLPTAAALVDGEGQFSRVNQKLCDIVGYTPDELVGLTFAEISVPEERAVCLDALRDMVEGRRTTYQTEKRYIRRDGSVVWVSLSSVLQRDGAGHPHCIALFEDITRRKTAELEVASLSAQLRAEHARLVAAQAVAKIGSWETDLRTLNVTWSQETYRIFELSPDVFEPTRETFLARVHPKDRAAVDESFTRPAASTAANAIEHRLAFEDGRVKYVEERWQVYRDEGGQPVRAVGTCQDVTVSTLALLRLGQSESLVRVAGRAGRLGGWTIDWPTLELVWSDGACLIHDLHPAQTPTLEGAMRFDSASLPEAFRARVVQCANDGVPFEFETPSTTALGRKIVIRVLGKAVRDEEGRTIRLQGAVQDVSDAHQATQALRESEERFRLLARAANEAVWDWNVARGTTWFSDGYETLFGLDPSTSPPSFEVWQSSIHPDDLRRVVDGLEAALASSAELWSDEYRFRRADGSYADVRDRGYVIRDTAGTAVRMVGAMTDLTEQKRAKAQLAQQAALLDQAHDAILVYDLDDHVQYWNRGAERLYGWSAQEAL